MTDYRPLTIEHLENAAALLAARHRRDRAACPLMPASFEQPHEMALLLSELFAEAGMAGVAAFERRRLMGYACGSPVFPAATDAFAGLTLPRTAAIPDIGFALAEDAAPDLAGSLYGALAGNWVGHGILAHEVMLRARPEVQEAWADLGFGRYMAMGACLIDDQATGGEPPAGVLFRMATLADIELVQDAIVRLFQSFAGSPQFFPHLRETQAAQRQYVSELMADATCPSWLAVDAAGRVVAVDMFVERGSAFWGHLSPLHAPERAIYLQFAYTEPEWRGTGLGGALLAHALSWAREAGNDICLVHWLTASRAASFYRRYGFRPVTHSLRRHVDARASWPEPHA